MALERPKARLIALAGAAALAASLAVTSVLPTAAAFVSATVASSTLGTLSVDPPASHSDPVSAAAGAIDLSWAATPTDPGAGRTIEYLVLRRDCCTGSYAQVTSTSALTHSDTPPSDGSYEYVIVARVIGTGGSFDSGDSAARTGLSDRTPPAMSILCDGAACGAGWYTAAVSVTVSGTDAGAGMGSVSHRIDGGSWTQTPGGTDTFDVTGDSIGHAVDYYGTDLATNDSGTSTQTIKIDATPPSTPTLSAARGPAGGPQFTVEFSWTAATDATSGVSGYTLYWVQANACPAASPADYPNAVPLGLVTDYSLVGSNNTWYCGYIVSHDVAGNTSTESNVATERAR
ncbi:MAG: hypothetical protein ACRDGE_02905 [Candidatus Limnocylindria bacterium]